MNEALFFATIIFCFSFMLIAFKLFGKTGIYLWIAFAMIMANIEATKMVDMFGFSVTLGNVVYGSTFLATDILSERYGKKASQRTVIVGFFALLLFTGASQFALAFMPNSEDFVNPAFSTIFNFAPRLALASIITYIVMQLVDIWLYHFIWKITGNRFLWLRNNVATLTAQLLDSACFTLLAFWGVFPNSLVIELIFTTYLMKLIVAVFDTPFLYLARSFKRVNVMGTDNCANE
ncbi:MAG: queuosine precursor transporter [Clostridia bacterium]|jgi:hypothetical protein|nr:queuosine precursor transporter [Clostridia bacterium]